MQNYNLDEQRIQLLLHAAGDSYEAPIYSAKQALRGRHQHDAEQPSQRLGHARSLQLAAQLVGRHLGPLQLRALPAGDKLQLRDSPPSFSLLHDQRRRLAERHRDHSLRPPTPPPARSPRPTSRTRRAPTAIPASPWRLMLCYNQFAVTPPTDTTLRSLRHLLAHHLPDRHGGRHGTQGGPEGHHLRNRRPGRTTTATASLVTDRHATSITRSAMT